MRIELVRKCVSELGLDNKWATGECWDIARKILEVGIFSCFWISSSGAWTLDADGRFRRMASMIRLVTGKQRIPCGLTRPSYTAARKFLTKVFRESVRSFKERREHNPVEYSGKPIKTRYWVPDGHSGIMGQVQHIYI